MIKYKQQWDRIKKIEIERETDHFVFLKDGRREAKVANYVSYFNTFEEAKEHIINKAKGKVRHYEHQLQNAKEDLDDANALTEE